MAFASSLFCSSKFLEHSHTLTKCLTVLACSDNTKDVRTSSVFYFLCQNIAWIYRRGRNKNPAQKKKNTILVFFFFFAGRSFFAPPSEWRPRRPPIPPVGTTAPVCVCVCVCVVVCVCVCVIW